MTSRRNDEWVRAVELWRSGGAVTDFMAENFPNLRDSNGEPLPEVVRLFLADLLWCKPGGKPRKGKPLNKSDIRKSFRTLMDWKNLERVIGEHKKDNRRGAMTDRDEVIAELAKTWNVSPATIDQIIYPRNKKPSP